MDKSEETNQQALQNRLARVSCEACAALAGYREGRPENDGVQNSLRAMLTPYICKSMREAPVDFVRDAYLNLCFDLLPNHRLVLDIENVEQQLGNTLYYLGQCDAR